MQTHHFKYAALVAAVALAACSAIPNANLEEARSDYNVAKNDPRITTHAGGELKQANDALTKANDAWVAKEDEAVVDQLAYITKQRVAITQEAAKTKAAEAAATKSRTERSSARLVARTQEADAANQNAEMSKRQAETARDNAEAAQRQSEESQRQSEASKAQSEEAQRQSDASMRQSEESQRHALEQQQRAQSAETRTSQIEAQLKELQTKQTDRGLVVTFGDVMFDTDKSEIKAGGLRNMQKLAEVLKQNPERNVLVEGFTDSVGDDAHNQALSDRRASAVRSSLRELGVSNDRVTGRGYGETFPVASNNTAAGRQLNRRVEVIISNGNGQIAPR